MLTALLSTLKESENAERMGSLEKLYVKAVFSCIYNESIQFIM